MRGQVAKLLGPRRLRAWYRATIGQVPPLRPARATPRKRPSTTALSSPSARATPFGCGRCEADRARAVWVACSLSQRRRHHNGREGHKGKPIETFPYVADTTASVDRVAPVTAPSGIVRSNVARQPPIFLARPRRYTSVTCR